MILAFFGLSKCNVIADLLIEINEKMGTGVTKFASILIICGGVFLCAAGTRFTALSLTALATVALTQLTSSFCNSLSNGKLLIFDIPEDLRKSVAEKCDHIAKNRLLYYSVLLLIAAILSYVLVSFIHLITLVVIIILIAFCYTEGYHSKLFNSLQITNTAIQWIILGILFFVILYFYFKIPKMILAIIFAFIGGIMITYGVDTLFNMGWKSLELFSTTIKTYNFDSGKEAIFVWSLTFAFGVGAQFLQIFAGSK